MEELDLKELFNMFWAKKLVIILSVLIFGIAGAVYSIGFVTPVYESYTTLLLAKGGEKEETQASAQAVTDSAITTTDITLNSKLVSTYSELVKSKDVIRKVISNLNMNLDEAKVRRNVSVSSYKDTEMIKVSVTDENPKYAAAIANEIVNVFADKVEEYYNINNVYVVDEAEVAEKPSNINHIKKVVIFAFAGFVVAAAYIFIANMLDTTIKSAEEAEKICGAPVLASIPLHDFDGDKGGRRKWEKNL